MLAWGQWSKGFPGSSVSVGEASRAGQERCSLRGWSIHLALMTALGPPRSGQPGHTRERRSGTDGRMDRQRDGQLAAPAAVVRGQGAWQGPRASPQILQARMGWGRWLGTNSGGGRSPRPRCKYSRWWQLLGRGMSPNPERVLTELWQVWVPLVSLLLLLPAPSEHPSPCGAPASHPPRGKRGQWGWIGGGKNGEKGTLPPNRVATSTSSASAGT